MIRCSPPLRKLDKKSSRSPLHNELRPIHFIATAGPPRPRSPEGGRNHYRIVMFSKTFFPGGQQAVELLALCSQRSLGLRAQFAAELLQEIRSVSCERQL